MRFVCVRSFRARVCACGVCVSALFRGIAIRRHANVLVCACKAVTLFPCVCSRLGMLRVKGRVILTVVRRTTGRIVLPCRVAVASFELEDCSRPCGGPMTAGCVSFWYFVFCSLTRYCLLLLLRVRSAPFPARFSRSRTVSPGIAQLVTVCACSQSLFLHWSV